MLVGGRGRLLLERESELSRLRALLDETKQTSAGRIVLLTGPAGIGKTALAAAARAEAEQDGFRVLSARGAELERNYAFGVVRQWFEPLVRSSEAMLGGAAALAAPVLLGDPAQSPDASFSILHGLYWLTAELAAESPLFLLLDDAQWSDAPSLRFVDFLARRIEDLPTQIVLTVREPAMDLLAPLSADPSVEVLRLPPLGLEAVGRFLRGQTHGAVDDDFARACREATGGNPFLLTELAQALLAENVEFVAVERGRVPKIGPQSVATSVQLRLAGLRPETTRLARAAAVVGDDTPLPLAAAVAKIDEKTAQAAADELAEIGVLEDGRPLRFVHPIVRAAIGESLLTHESQDLHTRAAELLAARGEPAEAVAVHLVALEPRGDEKVVETLVTAARRALADGAPDAAVPLLTRALAEPPAEATAPAVLLALGEAEHALEQREAVAHLRDAYRLAVDPVQRGRAALLLTWAVVSDTTEPRDVTEPLERSIAELADLDRDLALRLEAACLGVAWDRGDLDSILARGEHLSGLAGRTPGECLVLAYLAHARLDDGRPAAEVAPIAERAANLEFAADLGTNSTWLIHTGTALRSAERFEPALRLLDRVIAEAQARGSLRAYLLASMYRSAVFNRVGAVASAEADARAALTAGAREVVLLPAVAQLVESLVEQDRLAEAWSLLERHHLDADLADFRHGTVLLFSRAMLRQARGELREALADLGEARRRLDRAGRLNVVGLDGRVRAAELRRELGDREEAEHEARVAVDVARRWGTRGAVGIALRGLALARGDLELLREAAQSLGDSPLRLEHARTLVDVGATLRRTGKRAESRAPLREALALADECGAIAVRERARTELAASGVRVRREALRGAAALTPSERRIAERAAAGASNPEIAQALFVTVKTVEMHLSNAYRKLGISGRGELSRALAGRA